jgi:hypothetical protein
MRTALRHVLLALCIAAILLPGISVARGSIGHSSGPNYGGGHHTTSHGGHYADGHGSSLSRPVRIAAGQVVNDVRMQTHLNGWFVTAPRLPISLRAVWQDVHLLG